MHATDPTSERIVLGCMLDDPGQVHDVLSRLDAEDFSETFHRDTYAALSSLWERGETVDLSSVHALMVARGSSAQVSHVARLKGVSASDLATLPRRVSRLAMLSACRQTAAECQQIVNSLASAAEDPREWLDDAAVRLTVQRRETAETVSAADSARAVLARTQSSDTARKDHVWIGLGPLRAILGTLEPGALYIVSAPTSCGKSALVTNLVHDAQQKQPIPTLFASLEMSHEQISERIIAREARVNATRFRAGHLTDNERRLIEQAAERYGRFPLEITKRSSLSSAEFRSLMIRTRRRNPTGPIMGVLDYVQLARPSKKHDSREQEVAEISRVCKLVAGECACPVIALSQLNDDGRTRESRALENDADVWVTIELDGKRGDERRSGEIRVTKNRLGACGNRKVRFEGETVEFTGAAS